MIDLEKPEPKTVRVLAREPISEPRRGSDLEIIENDDGADRRLVHREEQSVFALRRIRRTVDEDQPGLLQTEK